MKIIPSEFTKIAWKCFLIAKKKAHLSKHQNIDSEHLLLAILQNVEWFYILLKKNNIIAEFIKTKEGFFIQCKNQIDDFVYKINQNGIIKYEI